MENAFIILNHLILTVKFSICKCKLNIVNQSVIVWVSYICTPLSRIS